VAVGQMVVQASATSPLCARQRKKMD